VEDDINLRGSDFTQWISIVVTKFKVVGGRYDKKFDEFLYADWHHVRKFSFSDANKL